MSLFYFHVCLTAGCFPHDLSASPAQFRRAASTKPRMANKDIMWCATLKDTLR